MFREDWEFQLAMRPIADELYKQVWGLNIQILRADDEGYGHEDLDRILAIDVRLRMPTGISLTGQEKFLRFSPRYFNNLTVEYMQNPNKAKEGDWFHFGGQWYFCGIAKEDMTAFYPWVLVDWPKIQKYTEMGYLNWKDYQNMEHGLSSLRAIKMKDIPPDAIIKSSYKYHINLGPLFNGYPKHGGLT